MASDQEEIEIIRQIDVIYDEFDKLFRDFEFKEANVKLEEVDIPNTPLDLLMSYLTVCAPARRGLPYYSEFYSAVEKEIRGRGEYEKGLFDDLGPVREVSLFYELPGNPNVVGTHPIKTDADPQIVPQTTDEALVEIVERTLRIRRARMRLSSESPVFSTSVSWFPIDPQAARFAAYSGMGYLVEIVGTDTQLRKGLHRFVEDAGVPTIVRAEHKIDYKIMASVLGKYDREFDEHGSSPRLDGKFVVPMTDS